MTLFLSLAASIEVRISFSKYTEPYYTCSLLTLTSLLVMTTVVGLQEMHWKNDMIVQMSGRFDVSHSFALEDQPEDDAENSMVTIRREPRVAASKTTEGSEGSKMWSISIDSNEIKEKFDPRHRFNVKYTFGHKPVCEKPPACPTGCKPDTFTSSSERRALLFTSSLKSRPLIWRHQNLRWVGTEQ